MQNDVVKYTSITDLIKDLTEALNTFGDIPVCIGGSSPIYTNPLPYYYDGGYVLQDVKDPKNFIRSKTWDKESGFTKATPGVPPNCVHLCFMLPEGGYNTLNGRDVRDIDPDTWEFLCEEEKSERDMFNGSLVNYSYDKNFKLFKAEIDSGEFSLGESRKVAKDNLIRLFLEKVKL